MTMQKKGMMQARAYNGSFTEALYSILIFH